MAEKIVTYARGLFARDFEAQVVKHLIYFERADQEAPVPLIEDVSWEHVKAFFRAEAATIGKGWLNQ